MNEVPKMMRTLNMMHRYPDDKKLIDAARSYDFMESAIEGIREVLLMMDETGNNLYRELAETELADAEAQIIEIRKEFEELLARHSAVVTVKRITGEGIPCGIWIDCDWSKIESGDSEEFARVKQAIIDSGWDCEMVPVLTSFDEVNRTIRVYC